MFNIIGSTTESATTYSFTLHTQDRQERYAEVKALGGSPVASFIVDTGHFNGLEVHTILDSGVVVIGNLNSKRLITWLIAREGQIKRYGIFTPSILAQARKHTELGLNYK